MIYHLNHPEIQLSSTSEQKIRYFEKILSGITIKDIKDNLIGGRNSLMIELFICGVCPLASDFIKVRSDLHRLKKTKTEDIHIDKLWKVKDRHFKKAEEEIYQQTGWKF
jgi:hypothetical protein